MLQAVPKAISSAFSGSFIKKLSQYLHDCVREEVKSSTFRNLKGDKENKWVFLQGEEKLFTSYDQPLLLDGSDSYLTELMIQGDMSQKEKYLIYGYLFLVGKNGKSRKNNEFLTPLLYTPCKLERIGTNIQCTVMEDMLSLNTGALAQLMKKDDEQEADAMLSGLLDVVPDLPLTNESLEIFLTTLKSLVPDIEIEEAQPSDDIKQNETDFYSKSYEEVFDDTDFDFDSLDEMAKKPAVKVEKLSLLRNQAVILTKRPTVTAGVLHELTQIGEKSTGAHKETVLNVILQEYALSHGKNFQKTIEKKELKEFFPITPLSLSDSQEDVIRKIEEHDFLAVYGPPGTGKSQTIVNLVAHLIARGKTVLVASRMDKAVDVVAQRLNELDAPYLALRAGRANYQKQLNFQLEDLLSNKVDLDSGFVDAVLVDVPDMQNLMTEIKRLEQACEKIINLEETYSELQAEKTESKDAIGELRFITQIPTLEEIALVRKLITKIENDINRNKKGFFCNLFRHLNLRKIRKILNIKKVSKLSEMLSRLNFELDVAELDSKILNTENEIFKIGNLHLLMKKIKTLKAKQKKLAVDILKNKRRTLLKDLLADQQKRQRLIVHAKSLVSRKRNLQNRLLEKEDFKPLLNTFPCWCVTTYAISNSLPLKPAMFDVVIIDEASQCDIASCFPILYRAKKAIIVGDDKQLPHLSFLEKAKEQSFLNQYNIEDRYQLMWRFRTNSMFDLANYYSASPVLLDEHFRSKKPIIEFSSKEFYGGRIKIMRPYFDEIPPVELNIVPDGKVDFDITRNMAECEALVKKLQDLVVEDPNSSIGVISPFRGQVELIKKAILRIFPQETILKHQIEVGTAHTFQGDERDTILISWTVGQNSRPQSLTFLQKPNLFNVAITRARKRLINFISKEVGELPEGLLRDYLEYVKTFHTQPRGFANSFKNDFEKELFETLKDDGYLPKAGVECAGVNIDILVNDKLIVECDGMKDSVPHRYTNMKKQAVLERCGFKVMRITKREWDLSKQACLDRIRANITE